MKKYVQITVILGGFFLLVFLRNFKGVVRQSGSLQVIPTPSVSDTSQIQQGTTVTGEYKNGIYVGSTADAYYGNIQVQAVITEGKLTDIIFLQHPSDNRTSESINKEAMPLLKQEALQKQNASVDIVSGASDSSQAFQQSLASALSQAK